jgi:hypothetical protein
MDSRNCSPFETLGIVSSHIPLDNIINAVAFTIDDNIAYEYIICKQVEKRREQERILLVMTILVASQLFGSPSGTDLRQGC